MFSTKRFLQTGFFILLSLVVLSGCSPDNKNSAGGSTSEITEGALVKVDAVETVVRDTQPISAQVKVKGSFKNGCEKVGEITQKQEGDTFKVTIANKVQGDDCSQGPTTFQRNIGLNVAGLVAGKYFVDVNGVKTEFELTSTSANR